MQTGTAVGGGGNNEESHLKLQLQRTTSVGVVGSSSISGMERSVSWDEDIQSIECDIMAQIKRDTNNYYQDGVIVETGRIDYSRHRTSTTRLRLLCLRDDIQRVRYFEHEEGLL